MNNVGNNSHGNRFWIKVRWAVGVLLIVFALINGYHYSSLFLLGASLLILPLSFVSEFLNQLNISGAFAIVLSAILIFAGVINSPMRSDNSDADRTAKIATVDDDKVESVWVVSGGKKYHSDSDCSNMKYPKQISIESAKKQGYTACKKCYK